jgi:hypothetical protein
MKKVLSEHFGFIPPMLHQRCVIGLITQHTVVTMVLKKVHTGPALCRTHRVMTFYLNSAYSELH